MKTNQLAVRNLRHPAWSWPLPGVLLWLALTGSASATSLHLDFTVPSSFNESNRQAILEWNAEPARTYLVQSTEDLSPGSAWKTESPVTATTAGPVRWMSPEASRNRKYYRLILPRPEVFSVEPSFVNSEDPAALLYLIGQCFPTNGSVVINGQNFTITSFDPNGSWVALSLNGLPPGTPILGNLLVLDNGSNIVTTLPFQNPVIYGPELTAEQLQGPPDEPPASPECGWTKGGGASVGRSATWTKGGGASVGRSEGWTKGGGASVGKPSPGRSAAWTKGGGASVGKANPGKLFASGDGDDDDDGDWGDFINSQGNRGAVIQFDVVNAKSPALRSVGGGPNGQGLRISNGTGEVLLDEVDLAIPGRGLDFAWTRTYRSRTEATTAQGAGWDFSYNVSATPQPDGTVVLRPGNGRADTFYSNGTNGWTRDEYFLHLRDVDQDGSPDEAVFPDGGKWLLHPPGTAFAGKLAQIVDRNNNVIRCEYDNDTGRLLRVVDTLDRTNTIAYTSKGLIESVTDFSGRTMRYEYDSGADLIACISPAVISTPNGNDFPGGKTNRYAYSSGQLDQRLNHNLVSITDPKGQTCLQITYQATNNPASLDFDAVSSVRRGIDKKDIRRGLVVAHPSNSFATVQTILNDYVGNVTEYLCDSRQRCVSAREFTGRANPVLPTTATENRPTGKLRAEDPDYFETRWEWNADSLCTREIRADGGSTEISHQRAQDHNSSRSNKTASRAHDGDVRVVRERASSPVDTDGDGAPDTTELAWYFEYDPRFGSPANMRSRLDQLETRLNNIGLLGRTIGGNGVAIKTKGTGAEANRFANGPRQSTSLDGSYDPATTLKFRARFPLVNNAFVTTMTDPRGIVTTAEYDEQGNQNREATVAFNGGNGVEVRSTNARHNARGQLTAITNAPDATGFRRVDTFDYYTNGPQKGYLKAIVVDQRDDIDLGLRLTTICEYDARGNLTRYIDPNGHDSLYTYNALDQLVRYQTPTNLTARCTTDFTYDANDNVVESATELRDENDAFVRAIVPKHVFDVLDRCVAVVEQVSAGFFVTNIFSYDANDNVVAVYSPLAVSGTDPSNLIMYQYDERDLLFREIPAPGSGNSPTNEWGYDPNGNIKRVKIELYVEEVRYDGLGRLASITDALSNVVTYAYDRNDNLVYQRVDAELHDGPGSAGNLRYHEWRWRYNTLDQCVEARTAFFDPATQSPIGDGSSVSIFSNAPNGQLVSSTDDLGRVTTFTYDTAGRYATGTSPGLKTVVATLRDAAGNIISVTQSDRSDLGGAPQIFARTNRYDSLNRCVSTVDNVGNTNRCAYDSLGNLVSTVDARDNETVFTYDDLSRQVGTTHYEGLGRGITINTTHVEYDSNSRIISSTDANTNTTVYAYDSLDRLTQTTEADGTVSSLVWSPRSNLLRGQDANGTVITNTYDLLDRLVRRDITPGPGVAATTTFEAFAYDGVSRLVAATNNATHNEFAYDSLGHTTRGTSGGLGAVVNTHDSVGNRLSMTYPSGRVVTYTYDGLDQVTNVSSGSSGLPPTTLATFFYDGPGRLGAITRANNVNTRLQWNGLVSPPNASGDFGWGQIRGINHQMAGNGPVLDRRTFSYDQKQNKTLRAQTVPFYQGGDMTTNVFAHDPLDRLAQSTLFRANSVASKSYVLDGNGNRQVVFSNGLAEPYLMDATIPPGDFQMNQYTMTPFGAQSYDANGNLIVRAGVSGPTFYHYDYADRLVEVAALDGGGMISPVASYSYDALGRRSSKTVYQPSPALPVTTEYVYGGGDDDCDGDIIEEYVSGALAVSSVSALAGGAGGGAAAASYAATGRAMPPVAIFSATGVPTYLHSDDLGNVLALTAANGTVLERYDYSDYGQPSFLSNDGFPLATNASPVGNPYLFRGMEWDAETGFYHDGSAGACSATYKATQGKTGKASQTKRYANPNTGGGITRGDEDNNPWSQRSLGSGGMPNRISMNVTVPKQTQGATFGEKVNAGLHAAGSALSQGAHSRSTQAQDHNSSRSNKTAGLAALGGGGGGGSGGSKAQDHNSSRSNKTAGLAVFGGGGGGVGSSTKQLLYTAKAGKTGSASGK